MAGDIASCGMVNGMEGCGSVESWQEQASGLVYSAFYSKYAGNTANNIYLCFQPEERIILSALLKPKRRVTMKLLKVVCPGRRGNNWTAPLWLDR